MCSNAQGTKVSVYGARKGSDACLTTRTRCHDIPLLTISHVAVGSLVSVAEWCDPGLDDDRVDDGRDDGEVIQFSSHPASAPPVRAAGF